MANSFPSQFLNLDYAQLNEKILADLAAQREKLEPQRQAEVKVHADFLGGDIDRYLRPWMIVVPRCLWAHWFTMASLHYDPAIQQEVEKVEKQIGTGFAFALAFHLPILGELPLPQIPNGTLVAYGYVSETVPKCVCSGLSVFWDKEWIFISPDTVEKPELRLGK